jgi:hypothetical protein
MEFGMPRGRVRGASATRGSHARRKLLEPTAAEDDGRQWRPRYRLGGVVCGREKEGGGEREEGRGGEGKVGPPLLTALAGLGRGAGAVDRGHPSRPLQRTT